MSENFYNSNGEWVHVDVYTRDDGTHVNEYGRSKYINSKFVNTDVDKLSSGVSANDYPFKPTVKSYTEYLKRQYQNALDDMIVNGTNKEISDKVGDVFSFLTILMMQMPYIKCHPQIIILIQIILEKMEHCIILLKICTMKNWERR